MKKRVKNGRLSLLFSLMVIGILVVIILFSVINYNKNIDKSLKGELATGGPLSVNSQGNNILVAYYPFDGNANDLSGNAYHGIINGATLTTGKIGQAYNFNGINQYINIPVTSSSLLNINGNQITESAWIYPTSNVDHGTIATRDGGYYFQRGNDSKLYAYTYGTTPPGYNSSTGTVPLNQWSFVAFTYDGSLLTFYINGVASGTIPKTGNIVQLTNFPNAALMIGWDTATVNGNGVRYFNGSIDEVKIWNYALSSSQINQEYQRGICVPNCTGKVCGSDSCGGSCGNCTVGYICNATGQCTSNNTTPPIISSLSVNTTDNIATITWNTDENSNSSVSYGTDVSNLNNTVTDSNFVTSHYISLSGLTNSTAYYYYIQSCDSYGNCVINGAYNFMTYQSNSTVDTTTPAISSISVYPNDYSTTITWNTDENSNSSVSYGTDVSNLNNTVTDSNFVTSHYISLSGLTNSIVYFYNINSCDIYGNCITNGVYNFMSNSNTNINQINSSTAITFQEKSTGIGENIEFSVSSEGLNQNNLVFGADNLPTGATLDAHTGEFSWTPNAAGEYTINFSATDGLMINQEIVKITVIDTTPAPQEELTTTPQIINNIGKVIFWIIVGILGIIIIIMIFVFIFLVMRKRKLRKQASFPTKKNPSGPVTLKNKKAAR